MRLGTRMLDQRRGQLADVSSPVVAIAQFQHQRGSQATLLAIRLGCDPSP